MKEYYSRLFLKDGSSIEEVKKAHRKLVKKFHPDKNETSNEFTEEFKLIQEAYEKLMDYFNQSKKIKNSSTVNEENFSNQNNSGIVKSKAKFAESETKFAEEGEVNETFYRIIQWLLIILTIFFGIYATLEQTNLIIKASLLVFITINLGVLIVAIIKKSI